MRIVLVDWAAVAIVAAAAAAGCGGAASANVRGTEVVAGFYPLAYAAASVGGGEVEVTSLTPPGAEPHDLELSVRDIEHVRSADLVLYLGAGFQPAVEEAAKDAEGRVLDLLPPGARDPHVWLDPLRYADIVERIAAALGEDGSAEPLVARLRGLDRELARGLADCERRELMTTHAAFGYLADRYGLEQIPIAGLSPEAEPAPQELEHIVELARARGVTTVYFETLVSPEVAKTVARETGADTAVLNPLEGLTEEEAERGEDYFSIMRANLAALREGLGCR